MKYLQRVILVALLALFFVNHAQSASKPVQNKNKVIAYDSKPFDLSVEKLNSSYQGHDLYAVAIALTKAPIKGEFETTAEYESRLNVWNDKPIVGSVKPSENIAIRDNFFNLEKKYDADSGVMSFYFDSAQHSAEDISTPYITTDSRRKTLPPVVGETAMGIKFKYERKSFIEFGAKLTNLALSSKMYELKVPPEVAKDNILWFVIYVGNPVSPYLFSVDDYHTPSLSERYEQYIKSRGVLLNVKEIWVCDYDGIILSKINLENTSE